MTSDQMATRQTSQTVPNRASQAPTADHGQYLGLSRLRLCCDFNMEGSSPAAGGKASETEREGEIRRNPPTPYLRCSVVVPISLTSTTQGRDSLPLRAASSNFAMMNPNQTNKKRRRFKGHGSPRCDCAVGLSSGDSVNGTTGHTVARWLMALPLRTSKTEDM